MRNERSDQPLGDKDRHKKQGEELLGKLEFGLPQSVEKKFVRPESARWTTSEFSACSQTCAGGIQTRNVFCKQVGVVVG